jgi:peroxiredoxin
MKTLFLIILTFTQIGAAQPVSIQPDVLLTARTSNPTIIEDNYTVMFSFDEQEYQKRAERLSKVEWFVPIRRKPSMLPPQARFGFNLSFGGLNRSWALDGNAADGYTFYADWNGNGDLNDERPFYFLHKDGKHQLIYETQVKEASEGREQSYPLLLRFEITSATLPGSPKGTEPSLALRNYSTTLRQGTININGKNIVFGMLGVDGLYDRDDSSIIFDLNGDGFLDLKDKKSPERYSVSENYVNLAGRSFEFKSDRYGKSLALKPLSEKLPDRAMLQPGNLAPEFSFLDSKGRTRKLSDYRGKVVLLDFWGSWCGPCQAEAPKLVEAYRRLSSKGFEIIGINTDDKLSSFQQFITEQGITWAQTREDKAGSLNRLFRVRSYPNYFLIGRDGTILANKISENLINEIENHVSKP